jgi:hypothetical protein
MSGVPICFAQLRATPTDIDMGSISPAKEQQFEDCSDQYSSPPHSPRYNPGSDDENDDVVVSLQLIPGDSSCSSGSEDEEDWRNPTPAIPVFLDAESNSEDDIESIFDMDPPYLPCSPGDQGPDDTGNHTAEYHVQFDGDSTEFLKWLDVVVLAKGSIPSSINGLELSLEDQKTLIKLLSQYRAWRPSVEFPCLPPTAQNLRDSVEHLTSSPVPSVRAMSVDLAGMWQRFDLSYDAHRLKFLAGLGGPSESHTFKSANEPLKDYYYAWTGSCEAEPTNLDDRSLFLGALPFLSLYGLLQYTDVDTARILRKCEVDGVELSEALWLFQGKMLGLCTRCESSTVRL